MLKKPTCTTTAGPWEQCLPGWLAGVVWEGKIRTQEQSMGSALTLETMQDPKHLRKNKQTGRGGGGSKVEEREPGLMHYFVVLRVPLDFFLFSFCWFVCFIFFPNKHAV